MRKKNPTSMRLTLEAQELLKKISGKLGITQSAVFEIAIRKLAESEGIKSTITHQ